MTDPQRPLRDPDEATPSSGPDERNGAPSTADVSGSETADAAAAASRRREQRGEVTDAPGAAADADAIDADATDADGTSSGADENAVDLELLADADPRTRAELYGALLAAEAQRDEYLDDLRRARAEFDNYRRRVMREGATQRDSGKAEAFNSLLDVLDDLERTVEASEGSDDPSLAKGLQLVATKLVSALGAQGLTRIDAVDAPFDPNEHEAVQQQAGDEPTDEPVVTEVLRPGYRLGDRVLRPAMVVVRS